MTTTASSVCSIYIGRNVLLCFNFSFVDMHFCIFLASLARRLSDFLNKSLSRFIHKFLLLFLNAGLERLTKHPHLMQSIFPSPSLISVASSPGSATSPPLFLSPTRVRSLSLEPFVGSDSVALGASQGVSLGSSNGRILSPGPGIVPEDLFAADRDIFDKDKNIEESLSHLHNADADADAGENGAVWKPHGSTSSSGGQSKSVRGSSPVGSKCSLFSDSEVVNKSDEVSQK